MTPGLTRMTRWLITVLCLIGLIFIMNEMVQAANFNQYKRVIQERASAVKAIVHDTRESQNQIRSDTGLNQYIKTLDGSVTLYDKKGGMIYPSRKQPQTLSLPETLPYYQKSNGMLTYIERLTFQDGTTGYMKLQGNLPKVEGLMVLYLLIFLVGIGLVFFYDRLVKRHSLSIAEAAQMAEDLATGRYDKRASESNSAGDVMRLNHSLNILARNLEKIGKSYLTQQERLQTLIENIGSGLVFIDGNGRISLVNKTYRETFKVYTERWEDENYNEVIPHAEVVDMIRETFIDERPLARQIQLPVHIERKHFDVSCAPILDQNQRIRGIVVVFHDITELKKLEKMRKDFVANVSHELKTPVTSVIGFTETLIDGATADAELRDKFLKIILSESKRLQSLITDLLELSKIEQEHFALKWGEVPMNQLLDETILVLAEKAEKKDIILDKNNSKQEALALGDAHRIRQIMINLITNAISYTPTGGHVMTEIQNVKDGVRLIVSDTGIGIDDEQIPRIFERFYRIDKARSRNLGGTGLGLAIVKHLVEAHNGRIDVKSKAGEGTTFEITFKESLQIGKP